MKHVSLIDYINHPELIRHVNGPKVKRLVHRLSNDPSCEIYVELETGLIDYYFADGRYETTSKESSFVLIEAEPAKESVEQTKPTKQFVKLTDYVNQPELIRHVSGVGVKKITFNPELPTPVQIRVELENDQACSYYPDGRLLGTCQTSSFILK